MAISTVVAVADDTTMEGGGVSLSFEPGDSYPIQVNHRLYVRDQPFPRTEPPTRVVPSIIAVQLSYGRFTEGQSPPAIEPDEHSFRELTFYADYTRGSWQVNGTEGSVELGFSAGLRDNSPSGERAEPDDPFVAYLLVQALCIWTTELTVFDRFEGAIRDVRNILSP